MNTYVKGVFCLLQKKSKKKYLFFYNTICWILSFLFAMLSGQKIMVYYLWNVFCQYLFNEEEGHSKANIESCTSTFHHQLHCHDLIHLQFFREKRWNFSLFTKTYANEKRETLFFKESSLNFQNLFKEKDRSFSVFNLFWSPKGKMCVRGQTWFHTKVEQMKRKEEKRKKTAVLSVCSSFY